MRSEKEIKEEITSEKAQLKDYYQGYNNALKWVLDGPSTFTKDMRNVVYLKELFEGETRYSVAELEEIFTAWCAEDNRGSVSEFIDCLKFPKRIKVWK